MKLESVFDQLSYGELRNVVFGPGALNSTAQVGDMDETQYPRLIPLIRLGLTALHKRFLLREAEADVTLVNGQATYTFAPAANDLMRIERIYGTYLEKEYEIPLNEIANKEAIRTTEYNIIVVPTDTDEAPWLLETTTLRVVYRADHVPISDTETAAATRDIDITLPWTHLEALCLYVAARVQTNTGIQGENFHAGNNYRALFEQECARLKMENMSVDTQRENTKLEQRGFA